MRYPKDLQEGGCIGFLAPSFGCAGEPYRSAFENALKKWKSMGYRCRLGPNCFVQEGVGISNLPRLCGDEVMEAFADPESSCLISCGGGELMCEILDYVDFDRLRRLPPKWFMGYSDNTNLTYLLTTLCDTASVYGPCAAAFGMEPWHRSLEDALRLLGGRERTVRGYELWEREPGKDAEHPLEPYHVTEKRRTKVYLEGRLWEDPEADQISCKVRGRLLGGCMDCLVNLLGTGYDRTAEFARQYKQDGILWFLEACDLNVYGIRRAMWQMEHAGWFSHVKGFLFGRALNGAPIDNLDACQAVLETAGRHGVPVLMDLDIGHLPPMMPLVTGSLATVTLRGNEVRVEMEYC